MLTDCGVAVGVAVGVSVWVGVGVTAGGEISVGTVGVTVGGGVPQPPNTNATSRIKRTSPSLLRMITSGRFDISFTG